MRGLTQSQRFNDEREMDESGKHDIELVESGKHAPEALEPAKETFDLVSLAVEDSAIFPRIQAIGFGRNDGKVAQVKRHWRVSSPS